MGIESILEKIDNISDGGFNTAKEFRDLLTEMTQEFSGSTSGSTSGTTGGDLETEITSNLAVGGIKNNTTFEVGTPLSDMWGSLLTTKSIGSLGYNANTTASIVEVDSTVNISRFYWSVVGTVNNLVLQDNVDMYRSDVTGTSVDVSLGYTRRSAGTVTWTLSGDDVNSTNDSLRFVYPSFYGKNSDGHMPTPAEVLAGTKQVKVVSSSITTSINTTVNDYGWIAVETTQDGGGYVDWVITALNSGKISDTSLLRNAGEITVDVGITGALERSYRIYLFNNSSAVSTLTLT